MGAVAGRGRFVAASFFRSRSFASSESASSKMAEGSPLGMTCPSRSCAGARRANLPRRTAGVPQTAGLHHRRSHAGGRVPAAGEPSEQMRRDERLSGHRSRARAEDAEGDSFHKIPSLRGVWYRPYLMHDGALTSLEEMFDTARHRPDYEPRGWSPLAWRSVRSPGIRLDSICRPGTSRR